MGKFIVWAETLTSFQRKSAGGAQRSLPSLDLLLCGTSSPQAHRGSPVLQKTQNLLIS